MNQNLLILVSKNEEMSVLLEECIKSTSHMVKNRLLLKINRLKNEIEELRRC